MGPGPTQDDEKRLLLVLLSVPNRSVIPTEAKWRDLQFSGPLVEMFFDRGFMGLRPTQEDEKHANHVCLALYQGTTLVVP